MKLIDVGGCQGRVGPLWLVGQQRMPLTWRVYGINVICFRGSSNKVEEGGHDDRVVKLVETSVASSPTM